jgi:hypothetical protein
MNQTQEICCPRFNPEPYEDKFHEWKNKNFIKDKVFCLFYIPLNFRRAMKRLNKKLITAGHSSPDGFCLSVHKSMWNIDLLMACNYVIPNTENVKLNGKYYSRVYEGDFKNTDSWIKDFKQFTQQKGIKTRKPLFWYTTCPKCANKFGKNYVVIFSEVKE